MKSWLAQNGKMKFGIATKNEILLESMTSKYKETKNSPNTTKKQGSFVAVSVMEPVDQRSFYRFSSKTKFRDFDQAIILSNTFLRAKSFRNCKF